MPERSATATNLDIVRSFYDGLESGDFINPLDYFHESMTWYVSDFLPWGGEYEGLQDIRTMLRIMRSQLSDTFETDELIASGNEVIAIGRCVGFVNETQENFCARSVHVWRFSEGRAVSLATYSDSDSPLSTLA